MAAYAEDLPVRTFGFVWSVGRDQSVAYRHARNEAALYDCAGAPRHTDVHEWLNGNLSTSIVNIVIPRSGIIAWHVVQVPQLGCQTAALMPGYTQNQPVDSFSLMNLHVIHWSLVAELFLRCLDMAAGRMFGKVSVVTGASSGLGRAIALSYAWEGSSLVCADLKPEAREEVPGEALSNTDELIRQGGGRSIFVKTDVRKEDEMKALIESTVAEYGRIDV